MAVNPPNNPLSSAQSPGQPTGTNPGQLSPGPAQPNQFPPGYIQPAQSSQPPSFAQDLPALGNPAYLQPYISSLPYYNALSLTPQLAPQRLSDAQLAQIQQRLLQSASNPVLTGQQPPHPRSVTTRSMSPQQIIGTAASQLFRQEIVDPVNGLIHEWQQPDKSAAIRDTLIAGGLIAAATAGMVFAPEVTAPILLAAGVATTLPGLVQSWGDEISNPSDANLVKALVSTGAGAIAVGSPVRALRTIGDARQLLETGLRAKQEITTAQEAADLIVGTGYAGRQSLVSGAPVTMQLELLATDPTQLLEQYRRRMIDPSQGSAATYRAATETLAKLKSDLQDARQAGDDQRAAAILKDIQQHAEVSLAPAQLAVSAEHVFLPSVPYGHVPYAPIDGVSASTQSAIDRTAGAIRGILREVGHGSQLGIDNPLDMSVASIAEAQALERAAGTSHYTSALLLEQFEELKKAASVTDESRVERVLQALEEPEIWDSLRPNERAFGQALRNMFDQMSISELRNGTVSHILQGRVPRYSLAVAAPGEETSPAIAISRWIRNPITNPHRTWKAAVDLETGEPVFSTQKRSEVIATSRQRTATFQETWPVRDAYSAHKREIDSIRASIGQRRRHRGPNADISDLVNRARQIAGDVGPDLLQMPKDEIDRILAAKPSTTEIAQGSQAVRIAVASHVNRSQMAHYGQQLASHANLNMAKLRQIFGTLPEDHWGASLSLPEFRSKSELPDILPESVFTGNGRVNPEQAAGNVGYYLIHPANGSPGDFHYRPALYARDEVAKQIIKAGEEAANMGDLRRGVLGAVYKIGGASKRVLMATPFWHGMNVAGRAIGYALSDPALARSSLKLFNEIRKDPEAYSALVTEAGQAGMVHANKFEVTRLLSQLAKEEDGQSRWPGAVRTFGAPISSAFHWQEAGFWRMVDQLQLVAYQAAKQRFRAASSTAPEQEIRRAAAMFASTIGGQVNPLYMDRVWRQVRGTVWFAPSYWSTFMHSLESVVPGSARLSRFLANRDGGRFIRFGSVPLRAIDFRIRKELVRSMRDFSLAYMATTFVSMDLMNLIGSGHHMWQNPSGRMFDVDVSNFIPPDQKTGQRHYISGNPFFRQGVDIANALGIGHDHGFAHSFGDPTWQQLDAIHKAEWLAGAAADGARQTAAGKVAGPIQTGYNLATGEEWNARMSTGTQRKIDRPEALLDLVPSGSAIQRALQESGQPNDPGVMAALQSVGGSLLSQYTGLPSIYQMGSERTPVDDDKMAHWRTQRTAYYNALTGFSSATLDGQMTPREYAKHKQQILDKLSQLNADTFGDSSPSGALAKQRAALEQSYGLNQLGLSDQEWYARYDAFNAAWEQLLQSADPATRATWWDNERAQWTDADYLLWQARSLKDALAASIDGQGGNYIRSFEAQFYAISPYLTQGQRTELEDKDPYYSTYKTLLSNLGQYSALGAFVSAFSSPFASTVILPPGFSESQAKAWSQGTHQTVIRSETAHQLAQQARQMAQEPEVQQSGGEALASPEFQQQALSDMRVSES